MKNLIWSALLIGFCSTAEAQQDGFRLGAHAGIPLSDASDVSSAKLGIDASYLYSITDRVAIGVASGYSTFLGKDDFDGYSFVPVAASLRGGYGDSIFYTADLGYALALTEGADGGVYIQPKLGWTNSRIDAFVFYQSISADGASLGAVGAGIAYKL
ncbi:MAG: hypothetical protein EOO10_10055 [Chitinophagaceae bacterium]|nr:MAG: hypothetical protein EOO10_10055 [Chitinophagaceae bacterium]